MKLNILLATTNKGKLAQYREVIKTCFKEEHKYLQFYTLDSTAKLREMNTYLSKQGEPKEDGHSFLENAVKKAHMYGKYSRMVAISDDSGIVVPALDFKPGVDSHRDDWSPATVMEKMQGKTGRNASMQTVCSWYDPLWSTGGYSDWDLDGTIRDDIQQYASWSAYGYDDIFIPRYSSLPISVSLNRGATRMQIRYPRASAFHSVILQILTHYHIPSEKTKPLERRPDFYV